MSNQAPDKLTAIYSALKANPNSAELYNQLGCIYYKQGQLSESVNAFEKSIRLCPSSVEAHFNLGNCYVKQNRPTAAIEQYQATMHLQPEHENAALNLAMTYVSENKYADALPLLERACALNASFAELQGHLAEAYLDLGMNDRAIAQFEKAIDLEPTRAQWLHNLGILFLRSDKPEQAKENFAKVIDIDPENQTAKHMYYSLSGVQTSQAPGEHVKDLFDQYAPYYNKHVRETLEYKSPELLRNAVSRVISEHSSGQNVLDIGCGTGLCGIYFRDLARYLVGTDLSAQMIAHAKASKAYDALCICNVLDAIPGQSQAIFDLVIAADVLVYIGDLQSVFSNIASALKERGVFAFTTELVDDSKKFLLQESGRYAHSSGYINEVANKFGFCILNSEKIKLRKDKESQISGMLYVLRKINEE